MVFAHTLFHAGEGVPLPGWLAHVVLAGLPLIVLCVGLLVLEARTRPTTRQGSDR